MTLSDSAKITRVTEDVARRRLRRQMPLADKAARADDVIDSSGDNLRAKVLDVLEDLKPSPAGEVVFRSMVWAVFGRLMFHIIVKQLLTA